MGIACQPPAATNQRSRYRGVRCSGHWSRRDDASGRRFDIAGDELTGNEAAAILSKVTGREVHYEGFPPDVLRAQSDEMAVMFEWFDRTGYAADIKGLRRDFPEVTWHSFEEWARKQDWNVEAVGT